MFIKHTVFRIINTIFILYRIMQKLKILYRRMLNYHMALKTAALVVESSTNCCRENNDKPGDGREAEGGGVLWRY